MIAEYHRELLRRRFRGQKVILAGGTLASARPQLRLLRELGAARPLVLADADGAGELPTPEEAEAFVIVRREQDDRELDLMSAIRAYEAAIANPPPDVLAAIDRWDAGCEALAILTQWSLHQTVAGRPVYGPRRPRWVEIEDKTRIDSFWDRAGILRAPTRIVPATTNHLLRAAREVDAGAGTVWAGDNRSGWHGGAICLRWVQDDRSGREAAEYLSARCDRVRVMPFLTGVPCSIHGTVFDDYVATYHPMEMVVLPQPSTGTFLFAGVSNCWSSSPEERTIMRDIARVAGERLRDERGYRGCYTVDGVMTSDGFIPTELNPRFGTALGLLASTVRDLPLYFINLAVSSGEKWDFRPRDLERAIRAGGATVPVARVSFATMLDRGVPRSLRLVETEDSYRPAGDGEQCDATLAAGPSVMGTQLVLDLIEGHYGIGQPMAVRAAKLVRFVNSTYGARIPEAEPSPPAVLDSGRVGRLAATGARA